MTRPGGLRVPRLVLLVGALTAAAAPPSTARALSQDFEVWLSLPVTVDLGAEPRRPQVWFDGQVRRGGGGTDLLLRPGMGMVFAPWVDAHVGYAWTPRFDDATDDLRQEHRVWEQATFRFTTDVGVSVLLRTRLEQRLREAGDDVGWRAFQLARFGLRFADGPHGIVLQGQVFVAFNDTDWGQAGGFDQSRVFLGWTGDIAPAGRVELGYMSIYLRRPREDILRHVAFCQIVLAL